MKLAVIKTGGKQYLVAPGDRLRVEKLPPASPDKADAVVFDQVLMTDDGRAIKLGNPFLPEAKVTAKRLADGRRDKITVLKYKNKTRYRVKRGHRQPYTEIEITGDF